MESSQHHPDRRKLKRPVVSDADGTREGGLVFCITCILGMVAASFVHPLALTSFWVWFALLMMAVAVASGTQKAVAWLNGHVEEEAET